MREFETTFREGLKGGLRKHHDNPRNAEALVECLNTRPTENGLLAIKAFDQNLTSGRLLLLPSITELEFEASSASYVDVIRINDNIGAIACYEVEQGQLDTIRVGHGGNLRSVDTGQIGGKYASICPAVGTYFAGCYTVEVTNIVTVYTVSIDSAGSFGAVTDTETYEAGTYCRLCYGGVFAGAAGLFLTYVDSSSDGWLNISVVTSAGVIVKNVSTYEFETATCVAPFGCLANDAATNPVGAIVWKDAGSDGNLATVTVNATTGAISAVDTLEFEATSCDDPRIYRMQNGICAIVYTGSGNDGYLKTVDIDSAGDIGSVLDTLEFDTTQGIRPSGCRIDNNTLAIVYQGSGSDGFLKVFTISDAGAITTTPLRIIEFDSYDVDYPSMCLISNDVYLITYQDVDGDGRCKTLELVF